MGRTPVGTYMRAMCSLRSRRMPPPVLWSLSAWRCAAVRRGKGLGREMQGMSEAITVVKKDDQLGVSTFRSLRSSAMYRRLPT
jgi:hypothetical protein